MCPQAGNAAAGPIGTGMTLSGGRNDTVMDNTFSNNGAWGILFVPYPDSGTPSLNQKCANYGGFQISGLGCVFEPEGDALIGNTFVNDGYFGNPSNADFGQIVASCGPAVELLRRQHRAPRQRAAESGAAPADLRRDDHDDEQRQHPACPGRVRLSAGPLSRRRQLPDRRPACTSLPSRRAADDGQSVRRSAFERLVPVRGVDRLLARDAGKGGPSGGLHPSGAAAAISSVRSVRTNARVVHTRFEERDSEDRWR